MTLRNEILRLKKRFPKLRVSAIAEQLKCSEGLVSYHLNNSGAFKPVATLQQLDEFCGLEKGDWAAWLRQNRMPYKYVSRLRSLRDKVSRTLDKIADRGYVDTKSNFELYCVGVTYERVKTTQEILSKSDITLIRNRLWVKRSKYVELTLEQQLGVITDPITWCRVNGRWVKRNWKLNTEHERIIPPRERKDVQPQKKGRPRKTHTVPDVVCSEGGS